VGCWLGGAGGRIYCRATARWRWWCSRLHRRRHLGPRHLRRRRHPTHRRRRFRRCRSVRRRRRRWRQPSFRPKTTRRAICCPWLRSAAQVRLRHLRQLSHRDSAFSHHNCTPLFNHTHTSTSLAHSHTPSVCLSRTLLLSLTICHTLPLPSPFTAPHARLTTCDFTAALPPSSASNDRELSQVCVAWKQSPMTIACGACATDQGSHVAGRGAVAVVGASGAVWMAYKALMQKAADDALGFSPNRVQPEL
jgi:hypothetical protein